MPLLTRLGLKDEHAKVRGPVIKNGKIENGQNDSNWPIAMIKKPVVSDNIDDDWSQQK